MSNYYYQRELKNTPSMRDNIDCEMELRYRKEGALFIRDIAVQMGLDCYTKATGISYFHRFYMYHSFRLFPHFGVACACLSIIYRIQENRRRYRAIINIARSLLNDGQFSTLSENPIKEIMNIETVILQTIECASQVEHPYQHLLHYPKHLKGDALKLEKLVQTAWKLIDDSLCTTLALQWKPEIMAVAVLHLAGRHIKFDVVDWVGRTSKHLRWWDMFVQDISVDLLEEICNQVLDVYPGQQICELLLNGPPFSPKPAIGVSSSKQSNSHEKVEIETPQAKSLPPAVASGVPKAPLCPYHTAFAPNTRVKRHLLPHTNAAGASQHITHSPFSQLSPDTPAGCLHPNTFHVVPDAETSLPPYRNPPIASPHMPSPSLFGISTPSYPYSAALPIDPHRGTYLPLYTNISITPQEISTPPFGIPSPAYTYPSVFCTSTYEGTPLPLYTNHTVATQPITTASLGPPLPNVLAPEYLHPAAFSANPHEGMYLPPRSNHTITQQQIVAQPPGSQPLHTVPQTSVL